MTRNNPKSKTDIHWDKRALLQRDDEKVNIGDTVQRELETLFILSVLQEEDRVLEVGCGNGYLTRILREKAQFVDAFDFSNNMIEQAKKYAGEENNRFFRDNILMPANTSPPYDTIICVRVLINLRGIDEQITAINNMAELLKPGGKLVLVEGFRDGFDVLDELRNQVALPSIEPAKINLYTRFSQIQHILEEHFIMGATFHTGMFDFLTRVVYPLLAGADQVVEAGEFHRKILPLASVCNPQTFEKFGRLKGMELLRK